jgi:hypothetical protein
VRENAPGDIDIIVQRQPANNLGWGVGKRRQDISERRACREFDLVGKATHNVVEQTYLLVRQFAGPKHKKVGHTPQHCGTVPDIFAGNDFFELVDQISMIKSINQSVMWTHHLLSPDQGFPQC